MFRWKPRLDRRGLVILCGFLVCSTMLAAAASWQLLTFDATPGESSEAPPSWPASSRIAHDPKRAVLLLFAHPLCSCTGATLDELSALLENPRTDRPAVKIVFFHAGSKDDGLWKRAAALPDSAVSWDESGREAAIFGARTSGQVLLYDARGALRFEGGITGSRGHSGDNYGLRKLSLALATDVSKEKRFPVFGCALTGHGESQ
jgi:hypothetical protein